MSSMLRISEIAVGHRFWWPILLLCSMTFWQCALRPIPKDLATYINRDIYGIAQLENSGLQRYAGLTGDNYVSDAALKEALDEEILPAYVRFADLTCRIEPRTEPVRKLHTLYRKAAGYRLKGFRMVLMAIDAQDPDLVRQANQMLDQGQAYISQWRALLAEMTTRYGLELKE